MMEEFLNVLIQPFDFFWVLALNRRSDIHADLFNIYFLSAIWPPHDQFWALSRGQSYSPCFRGHWQPHNNKFLKTWDGLQRDPSTLQNDWDIGKLTNTKKIKIFKKIILPGVSVGFRDRQYLDYWLDVEVDTLKVSLHCCQLTQDKVNSKKLTRISTKTNFKCPFKSPFN